MMHPNSPLFPHKQSDLVSRILEQKRGIEAISRTLDILHRRGELFEIRVRREKGRFSQILSGFFRDHEKAAQAAYTADAAGANAVYVTLNPVHPDLYALSPDALREANKTTADKDILSRRWLLIDIDPIRCATVSSTQAEWQAASSLAHDIENILSSVGFPLSILGSTGNGFALLYLIDLPNDADSTALVKRFYAGLDLRLKSDGPLAAKVDGQVCNAGQLCRLFGTTNRKATNIAERPHRKSELFEPPERLIVVSRELIEFIASFAPEVRSSSLDNHGCTDGRPQLRMPDYLADRGQKFRTKQLPDGTAYILDRCPFDESHGKGGEVAAFQHENGRLGFQCKHASCGPYSWRDFKNAIGPPAPQHWNRPIPKSKQAITLAAGTRVKAQDRDNIGTIVEDNGPTASVHFISPEGAEATVELPKLQLALQRTLSFYPG